MFKKCSDCGSKEIYAVVDNINYCEDCYAVSVEFYSKSISVLYSVEELLHKYDLDLYSSIEVIEGVLKQLKKQLKELEDKEENNK